MYASGRIRLSMSGKNRQRFIQAGRKQRLLQRRKVDITTRN